MAKAKAKPAAALSQSEILLRVSKGEMTPADAERALNQVPLKMNVSPKGAITFRGLPGASGRWGLTQYAKTVLAILDNADQIRVWIEEHRGELSWEKKPADAPAATDAAPAAEEADAKAAA
jgi:hypothetical protein